MLGSIARIAFSDRVVRRVSDDADAGHPRHSHKQDSLHTEPGQLAADGDNDIDYGVRNVAAVFPFSFRAGAHSPAGVVLAVPDADTAGLYEPYASD